MKSKFTDEQKDELLDSAKVLEWLDSMQIFKLWWWQHFQKKKIETFYESLSIGKAAFIAFKDAENA